MAYISRQQAIDDQNRTKSLSGGAVDGGGSSGPAAGAPQAPSTSSGNATGIRDYLRANQAGAAKLGQQVAGYINKEANDVGGALNKATSGFEQQASQQANTWNQGAVDQANASGSTTGVAKLLAGGYSGPRSLTDAGFRSSVDAELAQAKEKGELAKTMGGRVQLLREMSGRPQETGVTRLDAALLGGNATSANAIRGAVGGLGNLDNQISTAEQQAAARAAAIEQANAGLKTRVQDSMTAYANAKAVAEAKARADAAAAAQARAQAEAQARAQAEAQAQAAAQAEAARQAAAQQAAQAEAARQAAAQQAAAAAAKAKLAPVAIAPPVYESFGGGDSAGEGGGASDGGIGGTAGSGNDGGDSGGDSATSAGDSGSDGGGGGGGGGKIICTLMNDFYGLPYNENKVWIKYATTHLKPEHQKGYHAVFLPLVAFAKKPGFLNEKVRDCLFYIGKHRTIDIKAELAGTYRRPVHKFLRSVIEPTLAFIGRLCK